MAIRLKESMLERMARRGGKGRKTVVGKDMKPGRQVLRIAVLCATVDSKTLLLLQQGW